LQTVIGAPFNLSFLAWVALVPFVIAALVNEKNLTIILVSYIVGLLYWLGNLYWLIPITIPGWFVVCLYLAVYWPLVAMCLRYCMQKGIPLSLSLPILIVGAEAAWGWLFSWRFLAHSQYRNIPLIQISDIFGAAGVSFIVAMANGAISETILSIRNSVYKNSARLGNVLLILLLAAVLYYGQKRIDQTPQFIETGPKIGVVQSNVPIESAKEIEPAEKTFLDMLAESRKCLLEADPALIIWPETMVEAILDESYLRLLGEDSVTKLFHRTLLRHADEGIYLLVGAFGGEAEIAGEEIELKTNYNSAFLYEPNGVGPRQSYNKIHLVPFGEYIPLKNQLPFLYNFLMALTPYTEDYILDAGTEYTIFNMPLQDRNYTFGVMICFEDTIPRLGRKLAVDKNQNKRADWLVNITNDGWFVKNTDGKIKASSELSQHTAICVFRAVENRLSVIRCANTGISCFIDSLGNIKDGFSAGTLDKIALQRTGEQGWFADNISIDKRVTVFSKYGQILDIACAICLILTAVMSIYKLTRKQKVSYE
jgi:apolipoprotein N-acyltransferase